jgi:thiamine biosynthesis lipoprotein
MAVKLFAPPPLVRRSFLAMGTEITVTLAPQRRGQFRDVKAAMAELKGLLGGFGHHAWAWGVGSLAQFNREIAAGHIAAIPTPLKPLFERAWAIRSASDGLFEPRIAALVHLWGFDSMERIRTSPPADEDIALLLAALNSANDYQGQSDHYGPAPNTGWDFGGIGKGYIIDLALAGLGRLGFTNATIDAGGNVAVRGRRRDRPWRIGIRKPLEPGDDIEEPRLIGVLDASDESINTHGDDQRFFICDGRRYSHLLDPRTGTSARGLRSLTVIHHDGALAEAGGAALFVSGPDHWPALARKLGIDKVVAVDEHNQITVTAALASRLKPEPGITWKTINL